MKTGQFNPTRDLTPPPLPLPLAPLAFPLSVKHAAGQSPEKSPQQTLQKQQKGTSRPQHLARHRLFLTPCMGHVETLACLCTGVRQCRSFTVQSLVDPPNVFPLVFEPVAARPPSSSPRNIVHPHHRFIDKLLQASCMPNAPVAHSGTCPRTRHKGCNSVLPYS